MYAHDARMHSNCSFKMFRFWSPVLVCCTIAIASANVSIYININGLSIQTYGYYNSSVYIPKHVLPVRIQAYQSDVFLTYPRYRKCVPITLGVIDLKSPNPQVVKRFPHQAVQTLGDCHELQSAEDLFLEEDVLWILDTGIIEKLDQPYCICPPKVVGLCVHTGRVVKLIDLSNILSPQARLQFLAAEKGRDGSIYIYITDANEHSLWSIHVLRSDSEVTRPRGLHTAETKRIQLSTSGRCEVLYLALLKDLLILHCRGAADVFAVHTNKLHSDQLESALDRLGPSPAASGLIFLGTDKQHTLYYRFEGKNEVLSWDTRVALSPATSVMVATCRSLNPRLAVAAVSHAGRRLLALAVDSGGFVSGRIGCVGAEAIIFSID